MIVFLAKIQRTYNQDSHNVDIGSDIAAGYLLILVLYLIVSFIGLYKVIKHIFDGVISPEFKLLRSCYLLLTVAFFLRGVYFGLFNTFVEIICSRFARWEL